MARTPTLTFDRGTLLLHPPPRGKGWIEYAATWDDRVERFHIPALYYRRLVQALRAEHTSMVDEARAFEDIELVPALEMTPYPHQRQALTAWIEADRKNKRPLQAATPAACSPALLAGGRLLRPPLHAPPARRGCPPQRRAARPRTAKRGWRRLKLRGFPGWRPREGRFGSGLGERIAAKDFKGSEA